MKRLLITVLIGTALLMALCVSCQKPPTVETQPSASLTSSPSSTAPSPTIFEDASVEPPTPNVVKTEADFLRDLKQKYTNIDITLLTIREVSPGYQLINIGLSVNANRFVLYNSKTDVYEELPVIGVELKKVFNENYYIFEDTGDYSDSAFRPIPHIIRCFRIDENNGSESFKRIDEKEIFDLARSIQTGHKDNSILSGLIITTDGIEVVFKPLSANDIQFYADALDIPTTTTSYNEKSKEFTIEFTTNNISKDLKSNSINATDDNIYISSYKIIKTDDKTLIVLTLRDSAAIYTSEVRRGPEESGSTGDYPYFVLNFGHTLDLPLDY